MPSKSHEGIVNSVRRIVVTEYALQWSTTFVSIGQMASGLLGVLEDRKGLIPDLVILPPDGFGPMAVEVGQMPDGKWEHVIVPEDQTSIRVLRVGFDRSVSLLHPRRTKAETALLQLLETRLTKA